MFAYIMVFFMKLSVFLFLLIIIFFIDNSSSKNVDWHISNSCNLLFTLYATSFVGEVFALVSQYPRSPRGRVIFYGKLLYTCREILSEMEFFKYFMDEIVTLKNL